MGVDWLGGRRMLGNGKERGALREGGPNGDGSEKQEDSKAEALG